MAELVFINPSNLWFLIVLPVLVGLHFYSLNYAKRRALAFANYEAIEKITGGEILPKNYVLLVMRLVTMTAFVLAAATPFIYYEGLNTKFDFAFAIDSSTSMSASDVKPTRLEAAKEDALSFINSLQPGARLAVVSFSGASTVRQALTPSYAGARDAISAITFERLDGTAIGEALQKSADTLLAQPEKERFKAVILLTDGQNNVGPSPAEAIDYLKKAGITAYTIGIGEKSSNSQATNVLDEESLKQIASETDGTYAYAGNKQELDAAFDAILRGMEGKLKLDLTSYLMIVAFLLVLIDWGLSGTRYRVLP